MAKEAEEKYDKIAGQYHRMRTEDNPEGWFYNELLEMPATLELLGKVRDKKVLDLGCGTGIYSRILNEKGAEVKGVDISEKMLEIARKENPELDFKKGSVSNIPFDEKFDVVVSPLVFDYVENWDKALEEIRGSLKEEGIFVFSKCNPFVEIAKKMEIEGKKEKIIKNYFDEGKFYAEWKSPRKGDLDVRMPHYHKTYETITKILIRNGFEIIDYKDARPIEKAKELFPEDYEKYSEYPQFSVWKLKKK